MDGNHTQNKHFGDMLDDILNDNEVDMLTKERISQLISGGDHAAGENPFLTEPQNIEISGSSKSHNNMWNKRIFSLTDIPITPRNEIFRVIACHRNVTKIKLTKFGHSSVFNEYKIRIRDAVSNSGNLLCTLYGPSPISCTRQEFIIYVEEGTESQVKRDLESKLAKFFRE